MFIVSVLHGFLAPLERHVYIALLTGAVPFGFEAINMLLLRSKNKCNRQ
jgi:hypothetical protein